MRATAGASADPGWASSLRRASPTVRLLLGCELGFNVAFYMLMPFIAGELHRRGVSAAAAGLVLGTRTLSQQGLFPVGGWFSDRIGAKRAIVVGCFVRAAGFGLFGASHSLGALVTAAALSGAAAALFTPAMKASLATGARDTRREAFALAVMASQVGALAGPLIGVLLLRVGFAAAAFGAAAVFLGFGVLLLVSLPAAAEESGRSPAANVELRIVIQNRRFLAFVGAMAGYAVLFNQLYLVLPLALADATGTEAGAAWLFAITAVLVLLLQSRIARVCALKWSPYQSTGRGLVVMGLAFVPCALVVAGGLSSGPRALTAAVVAGTLVLAVGMMMAHPFAMDLISVLARERALGLHYGLYYGAGGLAASAGSALAGFLYDRSRGAPGAALLWGALAALGVACGCAIVRLGRRGPGSRAP
jgi:MFS family permease